MLLLCTNGLGFIMTNICKQKIFTAYKKGIPIMTVAHKETLQNL